MPEELAIPAQVAEYLSVSVDSLRQWRYLGTGPKFVRVGHRIRYRWSDVVAWLDARTAAATR